MESKGTLISVSRDWETGKTLVTFRLDLGKIDPEKLKEIALRITVKPWKEKRSLDANAYYWTLITKISEVINISKPRCHNLMLRRYGQNLTIDGSGAYIRIPDTENAEEMALEASEYHIRPTSQVVDGNDGVRYRTYVMLLGSSNYDTAQMSHLIDGVISECKALGIETLPSEELARMMAEYERTRHEKKTFQRIHR